MVVSGKRQQPRTQRNAQHTGGPPEAVLRFFLSSWAPPSPASAARLANWGDSFFQKRKPRERRPKRGHCLWPLLSLTRALFPPPSYLEKGARAHLSGEWRSYRARDLVPLSPSFHKWRREGRGYTGSYLYCCCHHLSSSRKPVLPLRLLKAGVLTAASPRNGTFMPKGRSRATINQFTEVFSESCSYLVRKKTRISC